MTHTEILFALDIHYKEIQQLLAINNNPQVVHRQMTLNSAIEILLINTAKLFSDIRTSGMNERYEVLDELINDQQTPELCVTCDTKEETDELP